MIEDIFACSMAKKSSITIMKNDTDVFACSMAKKSSITIMKSEEDKLADNTVSDLKVKKIA